MDPFKMTLQVSPFEVRLLLTDLNRNELLKAQLPALPQHPRALLTCLEGVALWLGQPLTAAISAGAAVDPRCAAALFGERMVPIDSALVTFDYLSPEPRRRTISGIGDFRQLRLLHGRRS